MILVERFLCQRQILTDTGFLFPGQTDQCVNKISHHSGFRRHRRHELELLELGLGLLEGFLAHAGGFDLLLELFEISPLFALTQFLLNGFDLLVQVILALRLLHLALDATTDTLLYLQNIDFGFKLAQQTFGTLAHTEQFEDLLFLFELERQMRGNGIAQTRCVFDA